MELVGTTSYWCDWETEDPEEINAWYPSNSTRPFWISAGRALRVSLGKEDVIIRNIISVVGDDGGRAYSALMGLSNCIIPFLRNPFRRDSYVVLLADRILPVLGAKCDENLLPFLFEIDNVEGRACDRYIYKLITCIGEREPCLLSKIVSSHYGTILNKHIEEFSLNTVRHYLEYSSEALDIPDRKNVTPLFKVCCHADSIHVAKELITRGANPFRLDCYGNGLFAYVMEKNPVELAKSPELR